MKKFFIGAIAVTLLVVVSFWVLFFSALQQGPSVDTMTRRICSSLNVSSNNLRHLGGYAKRDPAVFFELTGRLPENQGLNVVEGCGREWNVKMFNQLAKRYHIPYSISDADDLLDYRGDVFYLYIVCTTNGCCVLYLGS